MDIVMMQTLHNLLLLTLCFVLLAMSIIDLRTRTIPNELTLPFLLVVLCERILAAPLMRLDTIQQLSLDLVWSVLILLFLLLLLWLCHKFNSHGLGGGDIKLLTVLGLMFHEWTLLVLLIACISSLIVSLLARQRNFAFAPYIAFSTVTVFIIQQMQNSI